MTRRRSVRLRGQPLRLPSRRTTGSVLASALIPGIFGYLLTLFVDNRLLYGASKGSFWNEFYFRIFGIFGTFLLRLFFIWFCTHRSCGWLVFTAKDRSKMLSIDPYGQIFHLLFSTSDRLVCLGEKNGSPSHFRCRINCTRLSKSTSRTMRVAIAAASPKFKIEKPTW
jgi:hypothetical protein